MLIALTLLAHAAELNLAGTASTDSMTVAPWLDTGITLGAVGLAAGYRFGGTNQPGKRDKIGIETSEALWDPVAAGKSDVYLFLTGGPAGIAVFGGGAIVGVAYGRKDAHWAEGLGTTFLVMLETTALCWAVTDTLKYNIRKPRPFTSDAFQAAFPEEYASEEIQHELGPDGDAYLSMPSGHTSTTGAVFVGAATTWLIHELDAPKGNRAGRWILPVLAEGGALMATAHVADLRVQAGKHHPSDTIVGASIGVALGVGVPVAHYLARGEDARAGDLSVRFTGNGMRLAGAF